MEHDSTHSFSNAAPAFGSMVSISLLLVLTFATFLVHGNAVSIPVTGGTYDYVVIGGGTAGATLATRIAEDPSVTVILLEAGTALVQDEPLAFIPGADVIGIGASALDTVDYDWNFQTAPQSGAANRVIHYARGKGIGGSSQRNFMIYQRPTSDSFDFWTNATNSTDSPGWSWDDVYPYFAKSVVISPPNNGLRGEAAAPDPDAFPETDPSTAPLPLAFANFAYDYSLTLRAAFNELGYPNASDFSSGTLNGVQYIPCTIDHTTGHRASSQFFINNAAPSSTPSNLHVITDALATKINFNDANEAVSVTYLDETAVDLVSVTVGAMKEVLLCAGAFQSPQVLMLSGIGPREELEKFGIDVLVDLPGVGQNMQDHILFSPGYEIKPDIYNVGHETELLETIVSAGEFTFDNIGSLTNPVSEFLGWQRLNTSFISTDPDLEILASYPPLWPHIEYISAAGLTGNFTFPLLGNAIPANLGHFYYSLLGALIAPQSRGTVTFASSDPTVLPTINPGWLTSPTDQKVAVEVYRKIRRLFETEAFLQVRLGDGEFYPGLDQNTDEEILAVIQESLQTVWHASCTCSMQPRDNNGVLDPYLRVYGVSGLRVVDASSFPSLLPGHPQSVVYMLAERAADLLKLARGENITTIMRTPPSGDPGLPYDGPN